MRGQSKPSVVVFFIYFFVYTKFPSNTHAMAGILECIWRHNIFLQDLSFYEEHLDISTCLLLSASHFAPVWCSTGFGGAHSGVSQCKSSPLCLCNVDVFFSLNFVIYSWGLRARNRVLFSSYFSCLFFSKLMLLVVFCLQAQLLPFALGGHGVVRFWHNL